MSHINLSVYITAQKVIQHGTDPSERQRMIDEIKAIGASKVFIETWRAGGIVEEDLLREVKEAFEAEGFETATGIMPVRGKDALVEGTSDWDSHETLGGNSRWGADICYSRPWSREEIRRALQRGAAVFDEYIIDDALCTQCTCTHCREARGDKSWIEYRQDLLVDVCRDDIVGAAREINPDIHMILKYPQWYDRLHTFGYDTARQPELYDATWIGTETRDPDTPEYGYTPQYEAFFNVRWHLNSTPNLEGAWFDYIECDPLVYVEQAFQSVLGGVKDLTLFCYTDTLFRSNGYLLAALKEAMPRLERISERIHNVEPAGIVAIRTHNAQAEDDGYVFDSLGMIGMPLVPMAEWPEETPKSALFTDHSAGDPELTKRVRQVVEAGGTVFLTASVLALNDDNEELKELAGYQKDGWSQGNSWMGTHYRIGDETIDVADGIQFRFDLRPDTATVLAEVGGIAHARTELTPVVTRQDHPSGGAVVVLNVYGACERDYRMDENLNVPQILPAMGLPTEVVNIIQREVAKAIGGAILGPAKVAYYPFENGDVVIENFNDDAVLLVPEGTPLPKNGTDEFGVTDFVEMRGQSMIRIQGRSVALITAS
jgi:hypothetical protein